MDGGGEDEEAEETDDEMVVLGSVWAPCEAAQKVTVVTLKFLLIWSSVRVAQGAEANFW